MSLNFAIAMALGTFAGLSESFCPVFNGTCSCGQSDIVCSDLDTVPQFLEHQKNWSGLYMANQAIKSVPTMSFQDITVRKIVLNANDIGTGLNSESFSEDVAKSLVELHLSGCNLRTIPSGMLQNMAQLRELHLSDNRIETLPPFTDIPELKTLALWGNRIRKLDSTSFHGLSNLERLDLDHNKLDSIHKIFNELVSLQSLQMSHNQITTINKSPFRKLSNLRRLSLHNNGLTHLFESGFNGLRNLTVLELQNNNIEFLLDAIFSDLQNVRILNLNDNKLTHLWPITFFGLRNLQELHISRNNIQSLPRAIFLHLRQLRRISLDANKIKTLHQCALPLQSVFVSALANPLVCDCRLGYLTITPGLSFHGMCAESDLGLSFHGMCADFSLGCPTAVHNPHIYVECNLNLDGCDK